MVAAQSGGLFVRLCCRRFHKWLQCLTPAIDKLGGHTQIFPLTPKPCFRWGYQVFPIYDSKLVELAQNTDRRSLFGLYSIYADNFIVKI